MKKMMERIISLSLILMMIVTFIPRLDLALGAGSSNSNPVDAISGVSTGASSGAEDPLVTGTLNLLDEEGKNLDDAIHFIIRHWHEVADPNGHESGVNENGTPNYTVVVGGFIVPHDDGSYTYYGRAYNGAYEEDHNKGENLYKGFIKIDTDTNSNYIKLNEDGDIELPINPYHDGDDYYELFAGFSISSGQTGLEMYDGQDDEYNESARLVIKHEESSKVHLIKSHVFYTSQLTTVDGSEIYKKDGIDGPFPAYIDTQIYTDSTKGEKKYYNTNEGLHTDKTAGVTGNKNYQDGRTFDLDLESWFNDGKPVNVGMILDASGSMGFTLSTPDPIKVLGDNGENLLGLSPDTLASLKERQLTEDDEEGGKPQEPTGPRLVGHYKVNKNSTDESKRYRDYGLNSATGEEDAVEVQWPTTGIDFTKLSDMPTINDGQINWAQTNLKFNDPKGLQLLSSAQAFKLGVKLPSDNFTVSFTLNHDTSDDSQQPNLAEILYVGPLKTTDSNYVRVYRNGGGSRQRLRVDTGSNGILANVNTVFGGSGSTEKNYITLVFENNSVTTYVHRSDYSLAPDTNTAKADLKALSDENYLIFNPFNDSYNGNEIYIRDIYVYEGALNADQVSSLVKNGKIDSDDDKKEEAEEPNTFPSSAFLINNEIDEVLNNRNTDKSKLRSSGYSYFIYDYRDGVEEFVPLGYWDGGLPQAARESLIGYYAFNKNEDPSGLLNRITGNFAKTFSKQSMTDGQKFSFDNETNGNVKIDSSYGLALKESRDAVALEAPTSKDFTVSFTVKIPDETENNKNRNTTDFADIMYIGSSSGIGADRNGNFLRTVRLPDGNSTAFSANRGAVNAGGNRAFTIDNIFAEDETKYVTMSFTEVSNVDNLKTYDVKIYIYRPVPDRWMTSAGVTNNRNIQRTEASTTLSGDDVSIVLNAFNNTYKGNEIYVDDIYIFNTALDDKDVETLFQTYNATDTSKIFGLVNTTDQNQGIGAMNGTGMPATAMDRIGWYYVNPSGTWTNQYVAQGIQSGKTFFGITPTDNKGNKLEYVDDLTDREPDADDDELVDVPFGGTGKTYKFTAKSTTKFYIDADGYLRCFYYVNSSVNNGTYGYGASYVYQNTDAQYIKVEALQRALGSFVTELEAKSPESMVSAVRFSTPNVTNDFAEKDGNTIVKDENGWPVVSDEKAQDAIDSRKKLVLLDWTDDPVEAEKVLSNQRDRINNYGTLVGDPSEGMTVSKVLGTTIDQYNYGLTGSTSTIQGLKAFEENLKDRLDDYLEAEDIKNGSKYIIIFTDGKDTDFKELVDAEGLTDEDPYNGKTAVEIDKDRLDIDSKFKTLIEKTEAFNKAKELKEDGYTIFCILLAGGPVKAGTAEYNQALAFLNMLSGYGEGSKESNNNEPTDSNGNVKYVYSTEGTMAKTFAARNKVDTLVDLFNAEGGIMTQLTTDLEEYNVKDYIDPRFDLVDANDYVWHLNANGGVVVTTKDGTPVSNKVLLQDKDGNSVVVTNTNGVPSVVPEKEDEFDGIPITLAVSDYSLTENALSATLHYDGTKDMYYLEWEGQTIPGAPVGTSKTPVWHSRVTVRAKDDFLGGNAIMSNGNGANENYVYDPEDTSPSSGIDDYTLDTTKSGNNANPSKGFPRTTVNVAPPNGKVEGDQLIYMGQTLTANDIVQKIEDAIENDLWKATDNRAKYYWEYLYRYAKQHEGEDFEKLINEGTLTIPYSYILNVAESNQTGQIKHEADELGYLIYTWEEHANLGTDENPNLLPEYPEDTITKDTNSRISALTVKYVTKSVDERKNDTDAINTANRSKNWNNVLHNEGQDGGGALIYAWDPEYKPTAGNPVSGGEYKGTYTTNIVAGEIAVELVVDEEVAEKLPNYTNEVKYSADLYRTYEDGGITKQKVGTYTIICTIEDDGTVKDTIAGFEPSGEYEEYVFDYGLPIGTYTLEQNDDIDTGSPLVKFTELGAVEITNKKEINDLLFVNDGNFTTARQNMVYDNRAKAELITANLGTLNPPNNALYTDDLYALFQISLYVEDLVPLPETGGTGTMIFTMTGISILTIGAMMVFAYKKKSRFWN